MSWIDLLILAVLAVCAVTAFLNGFLVELFSLAGVVLGLLLAAAQYGWLAPYLLRWTQPWTARWALRGEAANLFAFLLIALGAMFVAGLAGRLLRGTVRLAGLGIADRLLGAVFGLIKGCVLVMLVVMAVAAFAPNAAWPSGSRLAPVFLTAAHAGSQVTASEFGERIRQGIQLLRMDTHPPQWPGAGPR